MRFFTFLVAALGVSGVVAHPGHDIVKEVAAREAVISHMTHRSLAHCTDNLKRSGIHGVAVARRSALLNDLQVQKGLASKSPSPAQDSATNPSSPRPGSPVHPPQPPQSL